MRHPITTTTQRYGDGHEITVSDATKNPVAMVYVNHRDAQSEYTVEIVKGHNTRAERMRYLQHPVVQDAITKTYV